MTGISGYSLSPREYTDMPGSVLVYKYFQSFRECTRRFWESGGEITACNRECAGMRGKYTACQRMDRVSNNALQSKRWHYIL